MHELFPAVWYANKINTPGIAGFSSLESRYGPLVSPKAVVARGTLGMHGLHRVAGHRQQAGGQQ